MLRLEPPMVAHRKLTRRRANNLSTISAVVALCSGPGALFGCRSSTTSEPVGETSPLEGVPASPPGASGARFGPPPPELMPPGVPGYDPEEWGEAEPPTIPDEDSFDPGEDPGDPQGGEIDPELAPRDPFAPPPSDAPLAPPPPEGIDL
jgi:hypothetical protein